MHEADPDVYEKRKATDVRLPGETAPPPTSIDDDDLHHMDDWFQCLRSRQDPHATVHEGFAHSVACIMAARSYWEGKKLYWDKKTEEVVETPPTS